jgi:hypothetical protein
MLDLNNLGLVAIQDYIFYNFFILEVLRNTQEDLEKHFIWNNLECDVVCLQVLEIRRKWSSDLAPKKVIQHGFFVTFQGMSERKICNKIIQKQLAWKVSNGNVWHQGDQLLSRARGGERCSSSKWPIKSSLKELALRIIVFCVAFYNGLILIFFFKY